MESTTKKVIADLIGSAYTDFKNAESGAPEYEVYYRSGVLAGLRRLAQALGMTEQELNQAEVRKA